MDENEYRQLKDSYKAHYKKINELKKKLAEVRRMEKINSALEQMKPDELMGSFDQLVHNLKDKISIAEAKISLALENLSSTEGVSESGIDDKVKEAENEEFLRRQKAQETLNMLKNEMGMLHDEIEEEAKSLRAEKTIGNSGAGPEPTAKQNENIIPERRSKTIGPKADKKEEKQ